MEDVRCWDRIAGFWVDVGHCWVVDSGFPIYTDRLLWGWRGLVDRTSLLHRTRVNGAAAAEAVDAADVKVGVWCALVVVARSQKGTTVGGWESGRCDGVQANGEHKGGGGQEHLGLL